MCAYVQQAHCSQLTASFIYEEIGPLHLSLHPEWEHIC